MLVHDIQPFSIFLYQSIPGMITLLLFVCKSKNGTTEILFVKLHVMVSEEIMQCIC